MIANKSSGLVDSKRKGQIFLYVGCGNHRMKGFTHVDISLAKNKKGTPDILADISEGIPLPNSSVSLIFSRATLEHLTYRQLINHLLECNRLLHDKGIIRIVVPNLDFMVQGYLKQYVPDKNKEHDPDLPVENYTDYFIYRLLYHDHYYLHNFDTLYRALIKTGFSNIRRCKPGDSKLSRANPELFKAEIGRNEDIIVEGEKSGEKPSAERYIIIGNQEKGRLGIVNKFLKIFNLCIVPYSKRRPYFPSRLWFVEKKLRKIVNIVDAGSVLK